MKKWTLNQGLNIFKTTKHKVIFIGNAQQRIVVPKTEMKLFDFLATGLKTEEEIKEWIRLNSNQWNFETLLNSGVLTDYFIDTKDRNSREDVFYSLINGDNELRNEIREKTILLIGTGGIGNHMIQYFSRINVKKIIIVDADVVEETNLNRQILFTEDDLGKNKTSVIAEKIKKYSSTEIVGINKFIRKPEDIKEIAEQNVVDFVVLSADSDIRLIKWCYESFALKGIPLTSCGYMGTLMISGPILVSRCFDLEKYFENLDSLHHINKNFENAITPSSIFMNAFISSYTACEILKYWTKKWKPETLNQKIYIDFLTWHKQTFSLDVE